MDWISGKILKEKTGADDAAYLNVDMFPVKTWEPLDIDWRLYQKIRHKKIGEKFGDGNPAPTLEKMFDDLGIDRNKLQTLCEREKEPSPTYHDTLRMWLSMKGKEKPEKKGKPKDSD